MVATPAPPDFARPTARSREPSPPEGWLRIVLRTPLFWKLLLPQVVLVGLLLGVAAAAAGPRITSMGGLALDLAIGVAATLALSAWVVHLALRPVRDLTETARRTAEGDPSARVPASALADPRIEGLVDVFNEMLDALADARRHQLEDSRRVLAAEERERERIAHELYAGTAQTLAGVLIRLRILQRTFEGGEPVPLLEEVVGEVRLALDEVRAVARRLRPPELDELGVRAALVAHARRLVDAFGVPVDLEGDVPEDGLDPGARLALFRIVQEGLTNAVEHARATRVRVRFRTLPEGFRAEVMDDGSGFDPTSAAPSTEAQLGLVGMRERAEYVQGRFTIESTPGEGTVLRLDLPWAPAEPRRPAPASNRLEFDLAHRL